jgi:hypothetical protein
MKLVRISILLLLVLALSACAGPAGLTPSPAVPTTEKIIPQNNSPVPETGLVIQGTVTLDGSPLEGVKIYRSFASYKGEVVAITGKDGTYRSEFIFIPGDEMVTVRAELEGYSFTPDNEYWRHYHGYEERTVDFVGAKSKP